MPPYGIKKVHGKALHTGQRRTKKIHVIGGFDPYESERNEWQDDVDLLPSTTYILLGKYLLVNPSPYTGEDLMNYRSLDYYINFVSGWVREVFVRKVNDKRVVIVKVSHQAIVPTLQKNNSQNNRSGSFNHIKIWFEKNPFQGKITLMG